MKKLKSGTSFTSILAIMTFSFISQTQSMINSVIQDIIETFPQVPVPTIRMISTVPAITALIVSIIVGAMVGKKIKFKTVCLLGAAFIGVGGLFPLFVHSSVPLILASRCIVGIGIGCCNTRNALIVRSFNEDKRAKMLGIGTMSANVGSVLLTLLCGFLGDIYWPYAFISYGVGIVGFVIMLLFLKEPDDEAKNDHHALDESFSGKQSLGARTYVFILLTFLMSLWIYPFNSGMSTWIAYKNLGTAATSGIVFSMYTIGGIVAGFIFSTINKTLKRFMTCFVFVLLALGQAIILYGNSVPLFCLGTLIIGIGFFSCMPTFSLYIGAELSKERVSLATTLILAAMSVGTFVSPYWIVLMNNLLNGIMQTDLERAFIACIVLCGMTAIISVIFDMRPKVLREKRD